MRKAGPFAFLGEWFSLRSAETPSSEIQPAGYAPTSGPASGIQDPVLPADGSEAIECARTAAEKGDPAAQNRFGVRFAYGQGVARDESEAGKWLRRAAEQGYAEAQFHLGNLCHSASLRHLADGLGESRIQAYMWFHLAAAQGHVQAKASSETLNLQLTDAELEEGNRRAQAFHSKQEPAQRPEALLT